MKIGILTFHRLINYGSYLQAYALKKMLEQSEEDEIVYVDYVPEEIEKEKERVDNKLYYLLSNIYGLRSKESRKRIKYRRMVQKFNTTFKNKWIVELVGTNKETLNWNVDKLVIGSDEVFNCKNKSAESGFARILWGNRDSNYKANAVISYAASFGNVVWEDIEGTSQEDLLKKSVDNFTTISVRDTNSQSILQKVTDRPISINLDPVFLYSFKDECPQILLKDYIVVYDYSYEFSQEEQEEIIDFAKKKNKKIVSLGCYYQPFCDLWIPASPFEVLSYIKAADYVIAATFHGTVFSIKYNKPFAVIVREERNKNKLRGLLEQFGLDNREIQQDRKLDTIMKERIDWTEINTDISIGIDRAEQYLKQNVLDN